MAENDQEQQMARPRMASGALFFDAEGHVLLVRPSYKPMWEIPGGYVETGESPLAACRREVEEELSITPAIGPLLVNDWAPKPAEGDKVLYIFDGGEMSVEEAASIKLASNELIAAEFHPLEDLDQLLIPRLARRVKQAVAAKAHGQPAYLEHGEEPFDITRGVGISQTEGARLFREAWIAGVHRHFPGEPKAGYVTPWEDTPQWERDAASAVHAQVRQFIEVSGGRTDRLSREQKGRFVATCWTAQMYKHFEEPKPGYVADWPELPAWQQETDADAFEAIEKSLN